MVPNDRAWSRGWLPWLTQPLSWFTFDADASAVALGLTSDTLPCDRRQFVYEVRAAAVVPWVGSPWRTPAAIAALEGPEQRPDLWLVSPVPVMAKLVRVRFGSQEVTP